MLSIYVIEACQVKEKAKLVLLEAMLKGPCSVKKGSAVLLDTIAKDVSMIITFL